MTELTFIDRASDWNEFRPALPSNVQSVSITDSEESSTTRHVRRPVA